MKKIKIGFIISNLSQGGAERQFVNLISHIDKQIFNVHVLIYANKNNIFYKDIFKLADVDVTLVNLNYTFSIFKIFEAIFSIRHYLYLKNFDLVYTTLFMNNLLVRLAADKSYNNKIVTSFRTNILGYNKWYLFFEKLLIYKSFIVFNSNKSKESFKMIFKKKFHKRLFMIANGFDLYTNISSKTTFLKHKIKIGGLGRFSEEKNFLQLLHAVNPINTNSTKKIKLYLKGSKSSQYFKIKEFSDKNPIDLTFENLDNNIDQFFAKINILIIPSKYEGCPNVLFESMIRKTICIISESANSDNYIINKENGFTYDNSVDGLKNILAYVITILGSELEDEILTSAYENVVTKFSNKVMAENYQKLFIKINDEN